MKIRRNDVFCLEEHLEVNVLEKVVQCSISVGGCRRVGKLSMPKLEDAEGCGSIGPATLRQHKHTVRSIRLPSAEGPVNPGEGPTQSTTKTQCQPQWPITIYVEDTVATPSQQHNHQCGRNHVSKAKHISNQLFSGPSGCTKHEQSVLC